MRKQYDPIREAASSLGFADDHKPTTALCGPSNPGDQIFLLHLALGADGERIEHS